MRRAEHAPIPPREDWPEPERTSATGSAVSELVLTTFRLNGLLTEAAQTMAAAGGLTAARWQVIGGVLDEPRPVAEVARRMGMTRQGVQRIADVLVERGLAEYCANPSHRRAKLLACTEAGYWAVRRISLMQHRWANRIGASIGADDLNAARATMEQLIAALESDEAAGRAE